MACGAIITGDQFLSRTLTHLDCQAQIIGSYGYQALGQPGSLAATLMTGLLTLFIALFGLRVMFGPAPGARDLVYDVLKIGVVLTLAFSWPAFRTVIYDVTLKGPAEIASVIVGASQGEISSGMIERLQEADNQMVRLTERGTGRNTGEILDSSAPGATFQGAALQDESTLGWARLGFLAGTIGSLALLRIAGGLLLALAPVAAGLLLFTQSRGLFAGWLKGLVLTLVGSVGVTLVLTVELALLEPWLADALRVRGLGYATPSAPIELLAITLAFAIAQLAMIWLLARVAFHRGWPDMPVIPQWFDGRSPWESPRPLVIEGSFAASNRADQISHHVETLLRREERTLERLSHKSLIDSRPNSGSAAGTVPTGGPERLGSSYRRTHSRHSQASHRRDSQS